MNYHVSRAGAALGVFSIEELRRRHDSGELRGDDLVWRQGLPEWIPLQTLLEQERSSLPPPIPPATKARKNGVLIAGVVVSTLVLAGLLAYFGIKTMKVVQTNSDSSDYEYENEDAMESASRPLPTATNNVTETVRREQRKEFRLRQYLTGYEERGKRVAACDEEARQLIQLWIAENFGGAEELNYPRAEELIRKILTTPEADDPLLMLVVSRCRSTMPNSRELLIQAVRDFENSRHKAYPRFFALVQAWGWETNDDARRDLGRSALHALQAALQDGSITPADQLELGEILVDGWANNWFRNWRTATYQSVRQAGPRFEWLARVLEGEYHIIEAWRARGGGYANTVTDEGWSRFHTHLEAARTNLTTAWELRPDLPLAPARMIYVGLGSSGIGGMRSWFDRTIAAQVDYPQAWSQMRWGLRHRWYGDNDSMLAFGITAINSGRFDTDVPRKFMDVVHDLSTEESIPPGEYLYGREEIWTNVVRMYEGYIAAPAQAPRRDQWRGNLSVVAFLAKKYDVAREQLIALDWKPPRWSLSGWGRDVSLMPLETAARTGPLGSAIDEAERSYARQSIGPALSAYQKLAESPRADERTRLFIRHRIAALELEQRFAAGEWVNFLPTQIGDLNWNVLMGDYTRTAPETIEVRPTSRGHLLYSRLRVGAGFEIRGEFEGTGPGRAGAEAGLVIGLPDENNANWQALRVQFGEAHEGRAMGGRAWTEQQLRVPITLNPAANRFELTFRDGEVTARINGVDLFGEANPPGGLATADGEMRLGLGGWTDHTNVVIRYRNVQVRKAP